MSLIFAARRTTEHKRLIYMLLLFQDFEPNVIPVGCLVLWYDSRLGCERSWVQFPEQPLLFASARAESNKAAP